ncbi:MAG: methyltransferase domain-containing protein [Gammaproteobacteria bacterium]|nr:methyltransferase domain-containing protein [Gammaproteobacteria bacterium]
MPKSFNARDERIIDLFIRDQLASPETFNAHISAEDEIYLTERQRNDDDHARACWAYMRAGKMFLDEVSAIVDWAFGGFGKIGRFLDFASGHGRFMRFLIQCLPPERIWACDIYTDAMAFQQQEFGVHTINSTSLPQDFRDDQRYDCIYVASLFSHLNEPYFPGWLEKLYSLLTPDGLLIFSTHGENLLPEGVTMDPRGIAFIPLSESRSLDKNLYGSSFVSEDFVRQMVEQAVGPRASCHFIPKGLADLQDLYLVSPRLDRDFSALRFPTAPAGFVDSCVFEDHDTYLRFTGWAFDERSPGGIEEVRVQTGIRQVAACVPDLQRPDVVRHLDNPGAAHCGWSLRVPVTEVGLADIVMIKAINKEGCERTLYVETVPVLLRQLLK